MRLFVLLFFFFFTKVFSHQLLAQFASLYDGISGILNADFNLYEHIDKIFIPEKMQTNQKNQKKFHQKSDKTQKNQTDFKKIKKIEAKRNLLENSNDKLSEFCHNVGYLTQVSIDRYYCFNQEVGRVDFESNLKNLI